MYKIASTRFTDGTWMENTRYRETRNIPCIYGSPIPTNEKYSRDIQMFVFEMNNSINQIVGVGLVRNTPCKDKTYIIYDMKISACNYNRFIFKGEKWMSRDQLPVDVIEMVEKLLFKGKSHAKRIRGISFVGTKVFERWTFDEAALIQRMIDLFKV